MIFKLNPLGLFWLLLLLYSLLKRMNYTILLTVVSLIFQSSLFVMIGSARIAIFEISSVVLIVRYLLIEKRKLINVKTIIVDGHNDRPELVKYLEKSGYHLEKNEFIYEAGIAYDIMKWKKGEPLKPYTEEEFIYGPLNLITKTDSWKKYWLNEERRITDILKNKDLPADKRKECENKIKSIKNVLKK